MAARPCTFLYHAMLPLDFGHMLVVSSKIGIDSQGQLISTKRHKLTIEESVVYLQASLDVNGQHVLNRLH